MTQAALAERAHVSVDMITKLETGASGARFAVIEQLAAALEIDPAELFTTEIPGGSLVSNELALATAKLSSLSKADLVWVSNLIEVALGRPRN